MKRINRVAYVLVLPLTMTVWGCESVALLSRPDVDSRDARRSGIERSRDTRDEVVGTVQRIDEARNEIHLRTPEGRMTVIKYDPATRVQSRDRDLRVDSLRYGDLILVQVNRNARGEQYADVIRMDDRQDQRSRRY